MGPLISVADRDKVISYYRRAKEEEATGGIKASGIGGEEASVHSLEFYTELKNVCIKL